MTGRPYPFVVVGAFVLSVIFLSSCSVTHKVKKSQRLLAEAAAQGAQVDTILRKTYFDTLRIRRIDDSFEMHFTPKIQFVIEDCAALLALGVADTASGSTAKAIQRIQKTVCPPIAVDSPYSLKMTVQGNEYSLPIRVQISNNGGHFGYKVTAGELNIPVKRDQHDLKFSTGHSTWDMVILAIIVALIAFFVGRFTK